ncbi:hypothetical protein [Rhizobium sp. MHM7A]|uniref:hypothetical protein n=1 Tax=Rhizobium sp. MHM7A TaxID=2583233 RepID=UPI00110714FA|nr:hypothetical protein [Rhizobium sp. MHM7A]TLX16917.1 hypothetical protein FFR93_06105 [Rhizobium sp. MHM7A]
MSDRKEWHSCPPSLDVGLWDKIPSDRKQDFFELAARQLRSGFHPNTTARKYLLDLGIIKPAVVNKPPADFFKRSRAAASAHAAKPTPAPGQSRPSPPAAPVAAKPDAPKSSGFKKSFKPQAAVQDDIEDDNDDFVFVDEAAPSVSNFNDFPDFDDGNDIDHTPTRPFGLKSIPAVGNVPKGKIGHAIHRLLGLSGEPGKKAAEAEASVLSAIAADPTYAAMEPSQLGNLGCSVPEYVLSSIEDLILEEVQAVTRDIKARKENSDPTVLDWLPPDEWGA